ncbi:hypothetical protein, partial [Roseobacter sp. TSBP12]|uniref:hypothetical protein n=1 Tax=Roseobacter sp. TSBP12 TaxID=1236613 RepID=UPI001D01D2C1
YMSVYFSAEICAFEANASEGTVIVVVSSDMSPPSSRILDVTLRKAESFLQISFTEFDVKMPVTCCIK